MNLAQMNVGGGDDRSCRAIREVKALLALPRGPKELKVTEVRSHPVR
jgi:hypothetical protein